MTLLNKVCFVLSTTSRISSWQIPQTLRSASRTAATAAVPYSRVFRMSTSSPSWPSPEAFNALSVSSRSKAYCDYGDEGKMTWKPHDEPPKVRQAVTFFVKLGNCWLPHRQEKTKKTETFLVCFFFLPSIVKSMKDRLRICEFWGQCKSLLDRMYPQSQTAVVTQPAVYVHSLAGLQNRACRTSLHI